MSNDGTKFTDASLFARVTHSEGRDAKGRKFVRSCYVGAENAPAHSDITVVSLVSEKQWPLEKCELYFYL